MSETTLFKNFLELVGEDDVVPIREGFVGARVQDISATGLAIHIGE